MFFFKLLEIVIFVKNLIIIELDGMCKLWLSVDVGEFKLEEIVVKIVEWKLIVYVEYEEKLLGCIFYKEFNKEYELFELVD